MSISISGLSGNIDFSVIRDAIVADRMRPVTQLQTRTTTLGNRSAALKQLNGLLTTLTSASQALTDTTLGAGRSAASTAGNVVAAAATSAAPVGTYSLNVTRTATNLVQASDALPGSTSPILAGGATAATFELRQGGASSGTQITIDTSNDSLAGLRDAINAANAGVTASIVDVAGDGTQNELVLSSTATGASGRVELIETTATGTLTALNLRSLNPPGATTDFSGLDAQLSINGLTITRPTNSIADAVTGLTFNLQDTGQATISVTRSDEIKGRLEKFVNAYNGVQDFAAAQYQKDANGRPTGVLVGDPTLRLVQQQLRDSINTFSTDNGGALKSLSELGVGRDSDGKLTLDTTALNGELQNHLSDVQAFLFGANGKKGFFNPLQVTFSNLSDNVTGLVHNAITGYDTSIQKLNKTILDQTQRINALKDSLTKQFAEIDSAINQLNQQGTTLSTIMNALQPKTK
jgi:flagellar hook-associated protein 2